MTDNDILWQTKLHARLHDPAEKALVLLRDPAGHEGGTSRALWRLARADENPADETLDNDNADVLHAVAFSNGIKPATYKKVKRADWWAAAADRPQWPMQEITVTTKKGEEKTLKVASWARVNWAKNPVLVHPLTGEQHDLGESGGLPDTDIEDIKQRSFNHFSNLLMRDNGVTDFKKSVLAYWRFGPDVQDTDDFGKLGALWNLLPADTRIPDHSIWDHLDLTSAFAGAFAADPDGEAALLSLAIGPVQPFIAAARSTSDLWAGSHLLSRLAWEAMRPVCEQLGPDAILFPRLRGIAQVDLWLRDQMELPDDLFKACDWNKGATDANPLFSAALPNRFVAVVPASQAKSIAEAVEAGVRQWLQALSIEVVLELLTAAGYQGEQENITTPYEQMKEQLQGFPEVHWAAVPFSLIRCRDEKKQRDLDTSLLSASMQPFFSDSLLDGGEPGFLDSPAWKLLKKELELVDEDGKKSVFFAPNPGVLYPAVFDLAERLLAAAKTSRSFNQTKQEGWRCSLTGETEWLTTDREQLCWNQTYRQKQGTLWTRIADEKPSWAKKGEHLGALSAIKRLWPTLFKGEIGRALADKDEDVAKHIDRFVVSTHTMALAHQLDQFSKNNGRIEEGLAEKIADKPRVALPARLAKDLRRGNHPQSDLIARIPGWLEEAKEKEGNKESDTEVDFEAAQREIKDLLGIKKVETYYSLIMMDGDHMGAILSGDESTGTAISYLQSFHPRVEEGFAERAASQPQLKQYGDQKRAVSPNRHLAISGALNDFSQIVVRHVVEEEHLGRLIYAGGDDVLAMLPVVDMLPAMQRLRYAYSGTMPEDEKLDWGELRGRKNLVCKGGFAWLNGRLMRMMGKNATASCGAVIAHHQAPLAAVRRELDIAEKRAKNEGGRDAFSITIIKRAGGALHLTEKWGKPLALLDGLIAFLRLDGVSRRAVYHTLEWLNENELPANAFDPSANEMSMAHSLLAYQLNRQVQANARKLEEWIAVAENNTVHLEADKKTQKEVVKAITKHFADKLVKLAISWPQEKRIEKMRNFLSVAEFLARETRTDSSTESNTGGDA